jgi:hypothetical protein
MNEIEVLDLKRQLEEEYKKDSDAIDRVLGLLRSRNGAAPINGSAPIEAAKPAVSAKTVPASRPNRSRHGQPTRVRGVLSTVTRLLKDLPPIFNREDISDRLRQSNPAMAAKVKPESLRSTIRQLVKAGVIELVEEASGPRLATYRVKAVQ